MDHFIESHYQNAADLHIGLTNSKGDVYEFDRYGLHAATKNSSWNQCLSVPIVTEIDNMWKDYWDYTLQIAAQLDRWQPNKYFEDTNNCYSFVITFLRYQFLRDNHISDAMFSIFSEVYPIC